LSLDKSEKLKIEAMEKALHFNPISQQLNEMYLDAIPNVFPSDFVMDKVQSMLAKEPYNIFYWKHYLRNATSSMSCDVLKGVKEFEKAMAQMRKMNDSDQVCLQLFKLCCLFVRQAGLNEQFFSLIHLMLSVNINESSELDKIFYSNEVNSHLLEYEELILSSNLPMNELWFRMESIRSICNFLPVKITSNQTSDPQRLVFNEDICNLIVPLKNLHAYKFDLFVMVLQLLKFPLFHSNIQNELFMTESHEIECGMHFLTVFIELQQNSTNVLNDFNRIMYTIIKDLNILPNYLSFNVEYEAYLNCILKILENCCNSFNDKQNKLVLIFWLRLQRLLIIVDRLKLMAENKDHDSEEFSKYKKLIKSKVKNILKNSKYQNDVNIYVEFALIESVLTVDGDEKSCDNILNMAFTTSLDSYQYELECYKVAILLCERKLLQNDEEACCEILNRLTNNCENALEYFSSKIEETRDAETCEEIEDYFLLRSNKLNFIKAKCYYYLANKKSKKAALTEILRQIENSNKEKSFLREKLYEFYIKIFHTKCSGDNTISNVKIYMEVIAKAISEYPKNLLIMHAIASQSLLRWFDVRKLLLKNPTDESIFYLHVASKYRGEKFADDSKIYQHRIFNAIDGLINRKTKGISSLLTSRIYLRTAFSCDFSKCKKILYETLDKNPMTKQLYLDGTRFLPEEHSQLHDLIIEKGLRAHAIIEELEILRNNTI
jgi:hypothetical protein